MEIILTITTLAGFYLVVTSSVFRLSKRWYLEDGSTEKAVSTSGVSLALAFCISFTLAGCANIIGHLIGVTISFNNATAIAAIAASLSAREQIRLLADSTRTHLNKSASSLWKAVKQKDAIILCLSCIFTLQAICLIYRALLPVTHGDALSQYFFDSLQISRMSGLSLKSFYELGQGFRSDSLASFFDALIIQSSDSWTITRVTRCITLVILLLLANNLAYWLGARSTRAQLLVTCIILTLPDVWDIGVSGKHDIYAWLFELTGASLIVLALRCQERTHCTLFLASAVGIGIASTSIRLSSLSFTIVAILSFLISLATLRSKSNDSRNLKTSSIITAILAGGLLLSPTLLVPVFNFLYKGNPFYVLSPPGEIMGQIFPYAIYKYSYSDFVGSYSLRNIPSLLKPISSLIYGSTGLEPARYVLNTSPTVAQLLPPVTTPIKWFLNLIGPKDLMVSMLSLSPLGLIPFTSPKIVFLRSRLLLVFVTAWMLIWGSGITYTRVIVSASIVAVAASVSSLDINSKLSPLRLAKINLASAALYLYGILLIVLFSAWSVSTLSDLPGIQVALASNRESQVREYIKLKNEILNLGDIVPSNQFEHDWRKTLESSRETQKSIILLNAPPQFAYFMSKGGLIVNEVRASNKTSLTSRLRCYTLNSEQLAEPYSCGSLQAT